MLCRGEVYGTWDSSSLKDGELLEYYEDLTDIERIKYDAAGNGAYSCWLRTSYCGDAYTEYRMGNKDENGMLKSSYSINSVRVAPACIIA